jgi:16S rRNA (uracil1498-N3)-methyltransferase
MPTPRVHVDVTLAAGARVELPAAAARHVQVLRLQPGDALTLFDGHGGEWTGRVADVGRQRVHAVVDAHRAVERELAAAVTLALGMPANERMDALVEKAAELGAAAVQPLVTQRSVLRLAGERAERRRAHWQAVAVAACEQCGRNRVPAVAPVRDLAEWLRALPAAAEGEARLLLSFAPDARTLPAAGGRARGVTVLSGPEGGLGPDEEHAARERGFVPVTLGARVLRADTAPLAALAWLALQDPS